MPGMSPVRCIALIALLAMLAGCIDIDFLKEYSAPDEYVFNINASSLLISKQMTLRPWEWDFTSVAESKKITNPMYVSGYKMNAVSDADIGSEKIHNSVWVYSNIENATEVFRQEYSDWPSDYMFADECKGRDILGVAYTREMACRENNVIFYIRTLSIANNQLYPSEYMRLFEQILRDMKPM